MDQRFEAAYEASPASVPVARRAVADFARHCGLDEAAVADVKLAVSEAATNALLHGYRDHDGGGTIRVEARCEDGVLHVAVTDDGDGMRPRPDSPGLGLGLPVIATVASRIEIVDRSPGTQVVMAFQASPAPA